MRLVIRCLIGRTIYMISDKLFDRKTYILGNTISNKWKDIYSK